MKTEEKQEEIQMELNLDNKEIAENVTTVENVDNTTEIKQFIAEAIAEAFKPFEMLLAEMKQVTDEVEEAKEELVEAKEEITEKIDTAETVIQQSIIEKLADRGIEQIDDNKEDTTFLSVKERLKMEYKTNPQAFLGKIK